MHSATDKLRTIIRATLVSTVLAGAVLFGSLFTVATFAPRWIERAAQGYLRAEVEASVRARFGDRPDSALTVIERTGALGAALVAQANSMRRLASSGWPERIAPILDALCCKERPTGDRAAAIRRGLDASAAATENRFEVLRSFVVGAYQARLQELIEELQFFSGVNAVLFGLVGVLLYLRRADMRPVLLPSMLLVVSTLGAATLYVTTQNWFWTILLGDYMGSWYLVLVGLTTAFAADVAFLKGRVSLNILSNLPSALVPPC